MMAQDIGTEEIGTEKIGTEKIGTLREPVTQPREGSR